MKPDSQPVASPQALDLLRLRLAPGINRNRFRSLTQHLGGYQAVRAAGPAFIQQLLRCPDEDATSIVRGATDEEISRELKGLQQLGARAVAPGDHGYPTALIASSAPAPLLFIQGDITAKDEAAVAIIGSRKATAYGMAASQSIAAFLARAGITVVSGFARGVDSAAHKAALDAGGRTLAILGNGLDICYPSENRGLAPAITRQGAFLTEYPLGTKSLPENFPERNLIIATLALGTAVMEAAERSGTLITCRFALEENRLLFALPGDVTRHSSRGTNKLIREGAILIQDGPDILRELAPRLRSILSGWKLEDHAREEEGQDQRPGRKSTQPKAGPRRRNEEPVPSEAVSRSPSNRKSPRPQPELPGLEGDGETAPWDEPLWSDPPSPESPRQPFMPSSSSAAMEPTRPSTLPPEFQTVLDLILREPQQYDDLVAQCLTAGLPAGRIASILLKLELQGLIRQMPGRIYASL